MSNPLFEMYGKIVDQLFSHESQIGEPISVCIAVETDQLPHKEWDDLTSELEYETLVHHASSAKIAEIQNAVDTLRRFLQQEAQTIDGKSGKAPITKNLQEFRLALHTKDDSKLTHNPFYAIIKEVYRLNLDAASGLFQYLQSKSSIHPPKPVAFVPTFREIWGRANKKANFLNKISATLDKILNSGKLPIEIFVFFGSTYTTSRGVSDLLQIPGALPFMTEGFGSTEAEFKRTLISVLCGLILSCAILDYKGKLFRSVAEAGAFFKGIWHAFKRYPRWMIIATLLTLISIKTNYDGIVSLVSKKADLDQQAFVIKNKVRNALGDPKIAKTANPSNLYDLQLILQEAAGVAIQKFLQIPKDEAGGGASSGNAGLGPRYWGKYYVTMGGYEPGIADIAHSVNSGLAQTLDQLMRDSGLDLKSSILDKISALRSEYEQHLRITADLANAKLNQLNELISMQDYSWSEVSRVFNLEHYEINEIVVQITKALETNTVKYKEIANRMNALTDAHVLLLKTLDKTGIVGESNYQIEAKAPIPNIDAIDELKKNNIPVATHKSFEELKEFLNESFGVGLASTLLLIIFFIAISMDMANPMLYSRLTAMQGQKDRKAYLARIKKLKEWENDFAARCKNFFDREDVEQVLSGISFPNDTLIRNTFSLMLEEVDPWVKDYVHFSFKEKSIAWFKSLFETTRILDIEGYNARAEAVHTLLLQREYFFSRFINRIFPGIMDQELLESGTFAQISQFIEEQTTEAKAQLSQEMLMAVQDENHHSMEARIQEWWVNRRAEHEDSIILVEKRADKPSKLRDLFKKSRPKSALDRLTAELEEAKQAAEAQAEAQEAMRQAQLLQTKMRIQQVAVKLSSEEDAAVDENSEEEAARANITFMRVVLFYLLQKAFMAPVPFFSYTRLAWLREIEARNRQFGEGLETLYDFIPTLKITLGETLPRIQDETFEPLMDVWNRFPIHCAQSGIEGVEEMEQKFMEIEKRTLEIWGVSQFLGPDLDEKVLTAVTNKDEIDEMARIITGDGGQSLFVEKLHTLEKEMCAALKRAKDVEIAAIAKMRGVVNSVIASRDEINQTLLKINLRGLEMRSMPLPPQALLRSLSTTQTEIEDAPKMASSILARIEAILDANYAFDEQKFEMLRKLEKEAKEIVANVNKVMHSMNKPVQIDRRLEEQYAVEIAARQNPVKSNHPQELVKQQSKKDFSRNSSTRRTAERQSHETRVMFTSHAGLHCEGVTRDISLTGLKMIFTNISHPFAADDEGILRLVWDGGESQFPCRVIRQVNNELMLQFISGQEQFQALVREELLAELAGEVVAPPPFEITQTKTGGGDTTWPSMLAKQAIRYVKEPSTPLLESAPHHDATNTEAIAVKPRLLAWGVEAEGGDTPLVSSDAITSALPQSDGRLLAWGPDVPVMDDDVDVTDRTNISALSVDTTQTSTDSLPVTMEPSVVLVKANRTVLWQTTKQENLPVQSSDLQKPHPILSTDQSDKHQELLVNVDCAQTIRDLHEYLDESEQTLLRINLQLMAQRRSVSEEPTLLQTLQDHGARVEHAPEELDAILARLRALPTTSFEQNSADYRLLMALQTETMNLWHRITEVQVAIGLSPTTLPPIAKPFRINQGTKLKPPKKVISSGKKPSTSVFMFPPAAPLAISERTFIADETDDDQHQQMELTQPSTIQQEALFQTLLDDNVQLHRTLRSPPLLMASGSLPITLTSILGGLWHVFFV